MKIYLIRHSFAGEESDDTNPARKLTAEGRTYAENLADWMDENGEVPNVIYSGPRVRCTETAEILRKAFGAPKVRIEDGLGPDRGNSLAPVVKKILSDTMLKRVAIVSNHDTICSGLRALDYSEEIEFDRIAMCELRIIKIDRDDAYWEEKRRVLPSELGGIDKY